jgi:PAS domain S-box-containing protein
VPDGLQDADMWLVDSFVVPASVHDVQGRFVHVNEAAARASGRSNAHWLGRHFTEPVPPDARDKVVAQFRRAVEGEPTDFETIFVDESGHLRGVRAQHLPLRSGEEIVGVLILAFDVELPSSEPGGRERVPQLTPRQREILELMASGHSTSEIAGTLMLAPDTVRNHVRNVLRELNVHTRLEAIASARRLGLLAPQALRPQRPDSGA